MKEYKEILVEQDGYVGIISLNSPPENRLSKRMISEILSVLDEW